MNTKVIFIILVLLVLIGCAPVQKTYSKLPTNTKLRIQQEFNNITQSEIDEKYSDWVEYMEVNYPSEYELYEQSCSYNSLLIDFLIVWGILSTLGLVAFLPAGIAGWIIEILVIVGSWSSILCALA